MEEDKLPVNSLYPNLPVRTVDDEATRLLTFAGIVLTVAVVRLDSFATAIS